MRCGSTGSGVHRKSLFINAIVLYGSRHLLVPSQVTGEARTSIPVIVGLPAPPTGINTTRRRVPHRVTARRERFMRRPI
jgi:hypothetical protein